MSDFLLRILGCGSSAGVPTLVGWGHCDPAEPRNRRTRSSALLEANNQRFLIDATPDVYVQLQRENIKSLDAVILSHFHADHTAGLIDVFFLSRLIRRKIPLISNTVTITYFKKCFPFAFGHEDFGFAPHIFAYGGQEILGTTFDFFPLEHGKVQSVGFRLGNVAYTIDSNRFTDQAEKILNGVEHLVIPARSFRSAESHMSLDDALNYCKRLGVKNGYITNMNTVMDYRKVRAMLPEGVSLCYDGLVIQGKYQSL